MSSWQYLISTALTMMGASLLLSGAFLLGTLSTNTTNSHDERVSAYNSERDEYLDALSTKYKQNVIVSPLEMSYIVTHYEIPKYRLETKDGAGYMNIVEVTRSTLPTNALTDAQEHKAHLESYSWELYKKYQITYNENLDGTITNLYFKGLER